MGLPATGLGTLVPVNVANLESISTVGSAAFLIIFAAVDRANRRPRRGANGSGALALLGVPPCLVASGAVVYYTLTTDPLTVLVGMLAVSFGVAAILLPLRRPKVDLDERFRSR